MEFFWLGRRPLLPEHDAQAVSFETFVKGRDMGTMTNSALRARSNKWWNNKGYERRDYWPAAPKIMIGWAYAAGYRACLRDQRKTVQVGNTLELLVRLLKDSGVKV